jgi:hypothetical protein
MSTQVCSLKVVFQNFKGIVFPHAMNKDFNFHITTFFSMDSYRDLLYKAGSLSLELLCMDGLFKCHSYFNLF